jgi:hypothetical protein
MQQFQAAGGHFHPQGQPPGMAQPPWMEMGKGLRRSWGGYESSKLDKRRFVSDLSLKVSFLILDIGAAFLRR